MYDFVLTSNGLTENSEVMERNRYRFKIAVAVAVMMALAIYGNVSGQTKTILFDEGFEPDGTHSFNISHVYGEYQISGTWARTGDYGFGYQFVGLPGGIQECEIETPAISTIGYSNNAMTFYLSGVGGLDDNDFIQVYVSPDNGLTWYLRLWFNGDNFTDWDYEDGTSVASAVYAEENIISESHIVSSESRFGIIQITDLPTVTHLKIKIVFGNETGGAEWWAFDDFEVAGEATTPLYTTEITGSPFCVTAAAGTSLRVGWESEAEFISNTFTVQLSDATGSFTNAVIIGTHVSNDSEGAMAVEIPAGTLSGTRYRIRVVSSNPAIIGFDNGTDLTINLEENSIAPADIQNIIFGQPTTALTVTEASTATSREWYYSTVSGGPYNNATGITSETYTPSFAAPGTYYVVCRTVFDCNTITSNEVQISLNASVTTGTLAAGPYCVTAATGRGVQVPFTSQGLFTGNSYIAQLSDASGSFDSPVAIGTLVSNDNSGQIDAIIPADTPSGTGYRIRVVSTGPALTSSVSQVFEIVNGISNVSSPAADARYTSVSLSWTNPVSCFDEIMIIAREGSAVTLNPAGDGSVYNARGIYGTGSAYEGGYVVYKGNSSPQLVTGLTNGTTYYFTLFTRNGDEWSTGTSISASPVSVPADAFWAIQDGEWNDPNTWSLTPGGSPGNSVPGPGASVFIDRYCAITAIPDISLGSFTVTANNCYLDGGNTITITTYLEVNSGSNLVLGYEYALMNITLASSASASVDGSIFWGWRDQDSQWYFTNNGLLQMGPNGIIKRANGPADRSVFILNPGGILRIGASGGITATHGTLGNILTTTRIYSPAADYVYEGAGNQNTGDGLPLSTTGNITVAAGTNLIPNHGTSTVLNNSGVITINGALTIPSGYTLESSGSNGKIVINSDEENSGSLVVEGSLDADGRIVYNRSIPDDGVSQKWHYLSAPVSVAGVETNKAFYPWDEVSGEWGDVVAFPESGKGYTVIGGGTASFTGSVPQVVDVTGTSPFLDPFDGSDYTERAYANGRDYEEGYGGGGWNLLGNPYPSAISVNRFIEENYNEDWETSSFDPNYVALYLFDGDDYQYVTRDESGWNTTWPNGTYLNATHIQAGQGFFVLAMNDGATFRFTRSMQSRNTSTELLKSAGNRSRWPGLALKMSSGTQEQQTVVMLNEFMTTGLDPMYDVGKMGLSSSLDIYTALADDNGVNFARQALSPYGDIKPVIPVGVECKGGAIIFSADIEPLRGFNFWLEDRVTGAMTDLSKDDYSVTLPEGTSGTGRFFLHIAPWRPERQGVKERDDFEGIRIWTAGDREVVIKGDVSVSARCEVHTVNGQKVYDLVLKGGDYNTFRMPGGSNGIFLVTVTDGIKRVTQRVVLLR